jgi:type II secretory pathway pseudopilin PulG
MKSHQSQKTGESGFSLIELLITSAILIFVIGIISSLVTNVQRSYSQQRPRTEALNDATAALDIITRLIRTAGNNPNGISGLQPIDPGTADSGGAYRTIRIRSDWRGSTLSSLPDGDITDPFEDITFSVANNKLMKFEPGDTNPEVFLDNVGEIRFFYYDTNNTLITNPSTSYNQICRVDMIITMSPPDTTVMNFTTSSFLRQR